MKHDPTLDRLRAARAANPTTEPPEHEALFARIVGEPGDPRLAEATGEGARSRLGAALGRLRPRVLAGSSLGLAGVAAGLVLAFSGSTAAPAFAITQNADGSYLVHLRTVSAVTAAERQLASMVGNEYAVFGIQRGAATTAGAFPCTGGPANGPKISLLLGQDGTGTVPAGEQGAGPWHLVLCSIHAGTYPGTPSNTGATGTGPTGSGATGSGPTGTANTGSVNAG